jgi:hypothetical protein
MPAALVMAALLAAIAASCSPTAPSSTPASIPLLSSAWETISDPQPFPMSNDGAALTFDFPSTGSMHYMFTASPLRAIRGTLVVSLQITTSGSVLFTPIDQANCGIPPTVRPMIWANDNGFGDYDRWWSNPRAFTLASGTATISVPLTPESWSSVFGQYGNADPTVKFNFDKALLNVTRLGLTFGGGCSFGHGISVRGGSARFALTSYQIQ